MLLIARTERIVDCSGREQGGHAEGCRNELAVFTGHEVKDGGIEGSHEVGQ